MGTKYTIHTLLKEYRFLGAFFYLLAIGIGMLFNYKKYSQFGINIFEYADVFDFLIAPFSDFRILLFTLISFLIAYTAYKIDQVWRKKHPKSYAVFSFGMDKKS